MKPLRTKRVSLATGLLFLSPKHIQCKPSRTDFALGQTGSTHPISTLPFEKDDNFVGREGIIAEIEKRISFRRRVAIAGIGGVG